MRVVGRGIIIEVLRNDFRKDASEVYFMLAWVLVSIFYSENTHGSDLTAIIAQADYSNHAIITYEEFSFGVNYLITIGWVTVHENRYSTTPVYKEYRNSIYENKKRVHIQKEIEDIEKYIRTNYPVENNYFRDSLLRIERRVYERAVDLYLKK